MTAYDNFLKPQAPIINNKTLENNYIVVCKYNEEISDNTSEIVITAYVLPTKTRLGLAVRGKRPGDILHANRKGWFTAENLSFGDGATGVISPDVNGNYFYFRRNHKYVITGNTNNAHY